MSVISDAYDYIVTEMEALFPNHTRLSNAYEIEQNSELFLTQGWGVAIKGASNSNRFVSCKMTIDRNIDVVISRKYYARELNVEDKADTEKELLEDHYQLLKFFESGVNLGGNVIKFVYASDGGIEFVFGDSQNHFMYINTSFSMEYLEELD